jgi:hypothetical protein
MSIAPVINNLTTKTAWTRFVLLWSVGSVWAYFLTSFFSNFYPLPYQFVLLGLLFQMLCGMGAFLFFSEIASGSDEERHNDPFAILTLFVVFALSISAVIISWQFPGLFHRRILFMDSSMLPLYLLLALISLGITLLLLKTMSWERFFEQLRQSQFFKFVQENLLGILLSIFFLFTYFTFAESINFPQFRTLDLYFDTDISVWIQRLTETTRQDVSMVRAVHPAILIFLRPVVWFVSIFLHGDRLHAVFLMNALAGASCVLLAWLIIKRVSGNVPYALIMASLLGASASHLLLSSMLETYIYSALAIFFFIFLIQNENTSLKSTVPAGILVFGITITNIIQTCILYFFKYPRIKVMVKYVLLVVLITAALNLLQVWIYPQAKSLFLPSNLFFEQRYVLNPFDFSWRSAGRFYLIARAIPFYGVVAPTPFILTEEIGMDVPNFRTYQILLGEFHVAGYRGLADVTVRFWIVLLALAGSLFFWNLFKSPKQVLFPLSLLLCLGFSFILHLVYGDDPVLYSPNWVYALILFVALALQRWAGQRWLQLSLIVFLIMLMSTNLRLISQIMEVSAPFYGQVLP